MARPTKPAGCFLQIVGGVLLIGGLPNAVAQANGGLGADDLGPHRTGQINVEGLARPGEKALPGGPALLPLPGHVRGGNYEKGTKSCNQNPRETLHR